MKKNNMELAELVKYYETYNRSEGRSLETVKWYREVLDRFVSWLKLQEKPTNLGSIDQMDVREFILWLREKRYNGRTLSSSTVNNRVRALRAFFSWLAREEYTETNILANLKPPKIAKTLIDDMMKGFPLVDILEKKGRKRIYDEKLLETLSSEVIEENPNIVKDCSKNPKAIEALIGRVMQKTKGQADPEITRELLIKLLKKMGFD